jgi:hypothetical protein
MFLEVPPSRYKFLPALPQPTLQQTSSDRVFVASLCALPPSSSSSSSSVNHLILAKQGWHPTYAYPSPLTWDKSIKTSSTVFRRSGISKADSVGVELNFFVDQYSSSFEICFVVSSPNL